MGSPFLIKHNYKLNRHPLCDTDEYGAYEEDERHTYAGNFNYDHSNNDVARSEIHNDPHPNLNSYLQRRAQI
ncbi:hypothetical protein MTR_4g116260 [Medicago truncatula]|uniref:Uncharacterized protein n=1 Tax=Medicago truncatula TaxID=3880 RepID=G7JGM6_MEDTR|nr:hypothetical protein MTR_4g116260 [Medicago truncatula]